MDNMMTTTKKSATFTVTFTTLDDDLDIGEVAGAYLAAMDNQILTDNMATGVSLEMEYKEC